MIKESNVRFLFTCPNVYYNKGDGNMSKRPNFIKAMNDLDEIVREEGREYQIKLGEDKDLVLCHISYPFYEVTRMNIDEYNKLQEKYCKATQRLMLKNPNMAFGITITDLVQDIVFLAFYNGEVIQNIFEDFF